MASKVTHEMHEMMERFIDFNQEKDRRRERLLKALKGGETPLVHKGFSAEVTKSEDETRTVSFVISTADVDRHGDTVAVEGWQLAEYRKNPVVLWAHDSSQPIGSARNVRVEDGVLKADAVFSGTSPKAIEIYNLVAEGHLKAVSVGFKILDYKINEERAGFMPMDITRAELWEFSVVSIPANPNALVENRAVKSADEVDALRAEVAELRDCIKAGRTLSQKNYDKLTEARDAISAVLTSAEPSEEDKQGGAAVIKLID